MGWKKFKEYFKIEHIVHIKNNELCIGSSYIPALVSINMDTGVLTENNNFKGFVKQKYPELFQSNSQEILDLIKQLDVFDKKISVYTYNKSEIIEDFAEAYGYPNITYSGILQYDNTFFKTKKEAIEAACKNNQAHIDCVTAFIKDNEQKLQKLKDDLAQLKIESEILKKI